MPKTVSVEKSIIINAPLDQVWQVTAGDFENIHRWDANVKTARQKGVAHNGAPVGGRVCGLYNGSDIVESIVEYDENRHRFVYAITEGLPGFIESGQNTWTHQVVNPNKTRVTMKTAMNVKGFLGTIMQGPMKSQIGKLLGNVQEELKHFVETGQPHPRKLKKLQKK